MPVEIEGFSELENELREFSERIDSLEGQIPVGDLFTPEFMRTYTDFGSFEEFLENSKWNVETQEDFERIPADEFDQYVDETTGFDSWETMLSAAGREYVLSQF